MRTQAGSDTNEPRRGLARLLREPLLHFLLIGGMLFALFAWVNDVPVAEAPEQILVTTADAGRLAEQFHAVWRRPPTLDELTALLDDHVQEEVYVREAMALGLDRDDAVIRQRLRQKMMFLTQSAVEALEPDDEELRAYFTANVERFTPAPRLAFRQVFLGEAGDASKAEALLQRLRSGADPSELGEPTLLPQAMPLAAPPTVDGTFGPGFFAAVAALPTDAWAGPIASSFGSHLVRLEQLALAELPPFERVRDKVLLDWRGERADALGEQAFARMRAAYAVTLPDPEALAALLR
jgi:hypothetical protein